MNTKKGYAVFLSTILFLYPFFVGGYYIFTSTAVNIILIIGLLFKVFSEKCFKVSKSLPTITLLILALSYLINRFWAVDSSMATIGFLKYLCVFLFALSIMQLEQDSKERLFDVIPLSAALMTLLAILLGLNSRLHLRFYDINEDLHGFFEYANAYAIFLLISLVILVFRHKNILLSILCVPFCIYGIYASNARAVWLLSIFTAFCLASYFILKKCKSKKSKYIYAISIVVLILFCIVTLIVTGYMSKLLSYINTDGSLNERYLYYKDALLYSLKHPFGKGAYAFYFAQPKFQSAYYYAIDVHNDYLQIMLEAGIIPCLMFVATIITQLFSKTLSPVQKFVLLSLSLHCFVDYDLQFTSLFFILTLCFNFKNSTEFKVKNKFLIVLFCAILVAFNGVLGLSNYYNYTGKHEKSVYYYKNTPSMLMLMQSTNLQQVGYDYANEILAMNDSVFEANNVLSNIYAENNDYDKAIKQMESVIDKDPREMQHYKDYIDLCITAKDFYIQKGDEQKAQVCVEKILSVPEKIKKLKAGTDERGIKYGRNQNFKLGKKHDKIISSLE